MTLNRMNAYGYSHSRCKSPKSSSVLKMHQSNHDSLRRQTVLLVNQWYGFEMQYDTHITWYNRGKLVTVLLLMTSLFKMYITWCLAQSLYKFKSNIRWVCEDHCYIPSFSASLIKTEKNSDHMGNWKNSGLWKGVWEITVRDCVSDIIHFVIQVTYEK